LPCPSLFPYTTLFRSVSCPIALYPATTESEKVRFHQLNKNTGHRIRYRKVDDETGEEVESDDIVKAYQISKGKYVEITDEDLERSEEHTSELQSLRHL